MLSYVVVGRCLGTFGKSLLSSKARPSGLSNLAGFMSRMATGPWVFQLSKPDILTFFIQNLHISQHVGFSLHANQGRVTIALPLGRRSLAGRNSRECASMPPDLLTILRKISKAVFGRVCIWEQPIYCTLPVAFGTGNPKVNDLLDLSQNSKKTT